jgi:hypothetical protein
MENSFAPRLSHYKDCFFTAGRCLGLILKNCFIPHHCFVKVYVVWGESDGSMRKTAVFLVTLLALASFGLVFVPKVFSQPQGIKVVSYSYYVDNLGYLDVVGEVQNTGSNTIESVVLTGVVYTPDGTAQACSYPTAVWGEYLIPQQKAPFYMEFSPETSGTGDLSWLSQGIDHVDFTINQATATGSYLYPDITLLSHSGDADNQGVYWVTGTIKNAGTQTATNVRAIGTFYNASGTVVAVGVTDNPPITTSLAPSSTATFKFGAWDLNQTIMPEWEKIDHYSLLFQAESPILNGTAPTPPASTPTPGQSTPTTSTAGGNPTPIAPETQYVAIIVIVIFGLVVAILLLRRRKPKLSPQEAKKRKLKERRKLR